MVTRNDDLLRCIDVLTVPPNRNWTIPQRLYLFGTGRQGPQAFAISDDLESVNERNERLGDACAYLFQRRGEARCGPEEVAPPSRQSDRDIP